MARWWYAPCIALLIGAPVYLVSQTLGLFGEFAHMQRVVMPGSATVKLPAGPSTFYVDTTATVDGTVYRLEGQISFTCHIDGDRGTSLTLDHPSASVRASIGTSSVVKVFETSAPSEGKYQLACSSETGDKFVLGVGPEVGRMFKVGLVFIALMLSGGGLTLLVFLRRRAAARARKARATPPPTR